LVPSTQKSLKLSGGFFAKLGHMSTSMIAHSRPFLGKAEERAVLRALRIRCLSEGPDVVALTREVCQFTGVPYGIATSSGTAALHLALLVLGVQPGDEVVIPSYVCSALACAIGYVAARPVVADIGEGTYNLTAETARKVLSRKTKAIIVPHMFGEAADLDALSRLGIPMIEDCAHSLGSHHKGRPVGAFGTLSVCSFYATKIISAGGGGFLSSREPDLIHQAEDLSYYGKKTGFQQRFNYRISNLQAAIARCQLRRLTWFIRRRKSIARQYSSAFRDLPLRLPLASSETSEHIYYRYIVQVKGPADDFRRRMAGKGVRCGYGVLEPLHRAFGLDPRHFPNSERAANHAVSIPIYPGLRGQEVKKVISSVKEIVSREDRCYG
jgi:perosamine synthetase